MRKIGLNSLIALLLLAVPNTLVADLYMWTDQNGITHICDEPAFSDRQGVEDPQKPSFDENEPNRTNFDKVTALREADIAFASKKFRRALRLFGPLAERGNPRAQNALGLIYGRGLGVPKDLNAAITWTEKAARQDYALAQYYLGLMYLDGQGVPRNADEGVKWLRKAAEQSLSEAQFTLGRMFETGESIEQDSLQAVRWYREAAGQGHAFAQHNLALMYARGAGVIRDKIKALSWEQRAAEAGDPVAQFRLATLYATGDSVPQNYDKAFIWFRKAAAQGNPLRFYFGKGWTVGHYAKISNQYVIIEFIKKGDYINNWKELLTIQVFSTNRGGASPEEMFDNLVAIREERCPGATKWSVVRRDDVSILYEWQATPCHGWPDQHEIAKIIEGRSKRLRIAYTTKAYQMQPDQRSKWLKELAQVEIGNNLPGD